MSLFERVRTLLAEGQPCALATVVEAPTGATPGGARAGAKLLIVPRGAAEGDMPEPLRATVRASGLALLDEGAASQMISAGGAQVFVDVYAPPPTLVIFGGVHTAIPLSQFARALGFRVIVVDGRAKFADPGRFPHADRVIHAWPQDAIPDLRFDNTVYAAVLTHDPKFDLPAIKLLVQTDARYIGAIGSKQTRQEHFERLRAEGVPEEALRRVHGPIGLDIGAVTPEEMALAIMAEIVAVRYNRDGLPLSQKEGGSRAAHPVPDGAP